MIPTSDVMAGGEYEGRSGQRKVVLALWAMARTDNRHKGVLMLRYQVTQHGRARSILPGQAIGTGMQIPVGDTREVKVSDFRMNAVRIVCSKCKESQTGKSIRWIEEDKKHLCMDCIAELDTMNTY